MNIQLLTNYVDVKTIGSENFERWILPATSLVLSILFLVAWLHFWVRSLQSNLLSFGNHDNSKTINHPQFCTKRADWKNRHPPIGVLWPTLCHISNLSKVPASRFSFCFASMIPLLVSQYLQVFILGKLLQVFFLFPKSFSGCFLYYITFIFTISAGHYPITVGRKRMSAVNIANEIPVWSLFFC